MNENFYNLMQESIGTLFWKRDELKEILIVRKWHSYMHLCTDDYTEEEGLLPCLLELKKFIADFEFIMEINGIENPCLVITFENNFLVDEDWEIIQNNFNEIEEGYHLLPTYCLDYVGDPDYRIISLIR